MSLTMLRWLLVGVVALSLALSGYSWNTQSRWWLQLLAAALLLPLNYWLIWGGLGYCTSTVALVQIALAIVLYRRARAR